MVRKELLFLRVAKKAIVIVPDQPKSKEIGSPIPILQTI
jgi:hypothetical protein